MKTCEQIGYICWMNNGKKKIYPNRMILNSRLSGCFNIYMNCR